VLDLWEGDTPAAWGVRWGVPRLEVHGRIGSTNDRARELAEAGAEPFTTVIAEEQTAGRGREGKRWESPPGSGLWMSVVAPPIDPSDRALVPLLAGLAVCRAVERLAPGVCAGLKWPNDVLLGARKVSGVLCEAGPEAIVIGVGINVCSGALGPELAGSTVALDDAGAGPVDRAALAERLLAELREVLVRGRVSDAAWTRELDGRDVLRDRRVEAAGAVGIARGIDPDGALRVEVGPGEIRRVVAGGVRVRA